MSDSLTCWVQVFSVVISYEVYSISHWGLLLSFFFLSFFLPSFLPFLLSFIISLFQSVVTTCGVYMFEILWHILVNVEIRWEHMYRSAYIFHALTLLCWWPCSETGVHKVEQCSFMQIAVRNDTNAWYWWMCRILCSSCRVGTGSQKWKIVKCQYALQWVLCVH